MSDDSYTIIVSEEAAKAMRDAFSQLPLKVPENVILQLRDLRQQVIETQRDGDERYVYIADMSYWQYLNGAANALGIPPTELHGLVKGEEDG